MLRAKICPNCGGQIDLDTYKCKFCGTQFYRDGEEDLVEYGYDNNFRPQAVDGGYATITARIALPDFRIKQFETDVEFRNTVAEDLAARLALALLRYLYVNISDSVESNSKCLQAYLKVKRYSAPRDEEVLRRFIE